MSKVGFLYVFDRVTGEPLWPIEERPVPASTLDGEQAAPTQPFPTWPPPFEMQGLGEDDLIDFTPELRKRALDELDGVRTGGLFLPASTEGSLAVPGWGGGANWGGAAFDPETRKALRRVASGAAVDAGPRDAAFAQWHALSNSSIRR